MQKPDTTKIPAFQRKRSLAAKARKKPTYIKTTTRKTRLTPLPSQELFPDPIQPEAQTIPEPLSETREMKVCGTCDGFFETIDVAVIKVTSPIRIGDRIIFEKDDGLFEQTVESIQINRKDVTLAKSGSDIGLKVAMKPTVGTLVYKVI